MAEVDSQVVGFSYASSHRSREAYKWSADCSIYLTPGFHSKGVGRCLYESLFSNLVKQNIVNVFAGISLPNDKSLSFHKSFGFKQIGVYKNVGYKLGKWRDVSWYQLILSKVKEPKQFIPYSKLGSKL